MHINEILSENRRELVKDWFEMVVNTYPPETAQFIREQKDPFANPVGAATRESLDRIVTEILKPRAAAADLEAALDPLIRIRAVQTVFTVAVAVEFPLYLKSLVHKLAESQSRDETVDGLDEFDTRIDRLLLLTFEVYTKCREAVHNLRARQEKNSIYKAFRRAGLVEEIPSVPPEESMGDRMIT